MSYAGRLDPMAEGVLLCLCGTENKKRSTYEALPKHYTFTALLGITTDTFDLLGKITSFTPLSEEQKMAVIQTIPELLPQFKGEYIQTYPPYSSYTVQGKPLYYWARQNQLHTITLPQKTVFISHFSQECVGTLSAEALSTLLRCRIPIVQGNFRQAEILSLWQTYLRQHASLTFCTLTFRIVCSSGTYVRSLVDTLGKKLGVGATTASILRTQVGDYTMKESVRLSNS
jgi:tRNA pseudouridine55 synthase